jgi:twitching motility protein PilT
MAHLDRFVELVFRTGADRLVLASDQNAQMTTGDQSRPVTAQPTTLPQVLQLLREIAPPDLSERMSRSNQCDFIYASPSGSVRVQVRRENQGLQVHIEPQHRRRAPAPSSEPSPSSTAPLAVAAEAPPVASRELEAPAHPLPRRSEAPARTAASTPATAVPAAPPSPGAAPPLEAYLRRMHQERCSDLHLSSECPPLYRKDGEMVTLDSAEPLSATVVQDLLRGITPERQQSQFEAQHDVDFSYEIPGVARFRCNLFLDRRGMGGVFRVIPAQIPSAESLGLTRHMLDLCNLTKGLVLVTGPTGSGKSTTLAAMIDFINRNRRAHIITVEDPIEFVHENRRCLVNQREVGGHTNSFKSALRAALREDPDIVLVGEMRDLETMEIAIETAETGHLVFGTLHTNTAASTVDRIIDQFPGDRQNQVRSMLADSLKGVIAQTLCKKKGGGLVAAHEVLLVNPAVSNLIREGKTFQITTVIQTGRASGMTTLNDSLLELVKQDRVDPRDAYAKAVARSEFRALLERHHIHVEVP